jgi:hypothetical protein
MRFGISAQLFALTLLFVALFGLTMGFSVGVEAETAAEATISFDGEKITTGTETTAVDYQRPYDDQTGPRPAAVQRLYEYTPLEPQTGEPGPIGQAVQQGVRSFVNSMIWVSFHLAAITGAAGAFVAYHTPGFALLEPILSGLITVTAYAAIAVVGYINLRPAVARL